jgi:DNA topoisomerase-1
MKSSHLPSNPVESALVAGLRYITADRPGLTRRRNGRGWVYLNARRELIRNPTELQRIKALVIPPAWSDVWICPCADGHLQALGIDSKGRKQYLYHVEYRDIRDATKFSRMQVFGEKLPLIRAGVDKDLGLPGLPRRKVLATVVRLLERVSARIGNVAYARDNDSFGITTLRDKHVAINGHTMRFRFKGKSGKDHDIKYTDPRLARIVALCQDLPGQELFQCVEKGCEPSVICSEDVNAYVRDLSGETFTAKDFRTWNGTKEAIHALYESGPPESAADAKRKTVQAVKQVAGTLRNTAATCKKYYIHPAVIEAFETSTLFPIIDKAKPGPEPHGLQHEEVALLKIIAGYSPFTIQDRRKALAA